MTQTTPQAPTPTPNQPADGQPIAKTDPSQLASGAGVVTVLIGSALAVRPAATAKLLGLGVSPAVARGLGAVDLVVGPKLLAGERRYPWMTLRSVLNLGLAAQYRREAARTGSKTAKGGFLAMTALTLLDGAVAFSLARRERKLD